MLTKVVEEGFVKAILRIVQWSLIGIFLAMIGNLVFDFARGRDDTDSPTVRSNLVIYTDYGTGCQYLGSDRGGLTPRLSETGQSICGESN